MINPAHAKPQWNGYTCGPAALRCALLCYGDRVDGRRLAALGRTTPEEGTDQMGLDAAAREFGFYLAHEAYVTPAEAAAAILGHLRAKTPLLLCVDWDPDKDEMTHWIAVVRGTTRHAWVCDPAPSKGGGIERVTWRHLLRRLHYGLPDELQFDLYPLVPV